jgi:CHAD domain-containing protein
MSNLRETLERELKLSGGPEFSLSEALEGEPLETRLFVSTYHDTADHRLAASGITLRHRVENGSGLWQLKLPQRAARLELEAPGGPVKAPAQLTRLLPALRRGQELVPVAVLRTRREGLRADGAEVVHDSVAVMDGEKVVHTFEELEVELVDGGDERSLRKIEKTLRRAGARDGETRPKLMRALDLDHSAPADDSAGDGSTGDVLAAAFRLQYARLLAHDPGTRLGSDPEDLHQLRVATRRLRAFLRAGRDVLEREWADALRDELGWFGGALGPMRDLDVLLEHLRNEALQLGDDDAQAAGELVAALEKQQAAARAELAAALDSERYLALLDRVEAAREPPLVGDGAVELEDLWSDEHKRLRKAVQRLGGDPDDTDLHAARVKAKRARYAAELAGHDGYVKAAKRLQDVLGEHQDAAVAEERLRELAAATPAPVALAAGRLVERQRERRRRARKDWRKAWKQLAKQAQ